jgi:hypothetical protein
MESSGGWCNIANPGGVKAIMRKVADMWRNLFDIRAGEYRRTVFMSLYLLFVMFAYYVLRTASEAMFLNKFDIDKLPNLYILMAIFGGGLAFAYSKTAARTSLHTAVTWTVFLGGVPARHVVPATEPQRHDHDLGLRGLGPAVQYRHRNSGLGGGEQSLHLTGSQARLRPAGYGHGGRSRLRRGIYHPDGTLHRNQ